MEFYCNKEELSKSLGIVGKAVPSKSTMPILECVLFTVDNDEIMLTANDLEIGIETSMDGTIKENGTVAIDAKLLTPIIAKLPDGEVHIKTDDEVTHISCGKSKFKIASRLGDDFPTIESVDRDDCITVDQDDLRDIIGQTVFSAAAQNDANKIMTGELFDISEKLKVVALDGHRIAIRETDISEHTPTKIIIPGKTLLEIMRMPFKGDVDIYITQSMALFHYGTTSITTRLIEGDYFNIEQILQVESETTVKIDRKSLIDSLDRAILLINENDRKPAILTLSDDEVKIEVVTSRGSMDESIPIKVDGEKELKIGVNPKFLLDALKAIDDEEVELFFKGSKAPCLIKGEGYVYVVLPVNIGA